MAKKIDFKHSASGYFELMNSGAVQADLLARAQKVANTADSMVGASPTARNENFYAHVHAGGTRARATVVTGNPHSIAHNAKYNTLLKSLGSGR